MLRLFISLMLTIWIVSPQCSFAGHSPDNKFSIAFFYGANSPLNELKAFDIVVVDPDTVNGSPLEYNSPRSQLFAYLSVGEADPKRTWYVNTNPKWFIADNVTWKSKVVDLANPAWRAFFLDIIVEPLWSDGYRGFFLDTLDSYHLVKDKKRHPDLEAGLVQIIRDLKKRHPEARLIFNRGFEVLDQVKDAAFAVAAESLFQKFDPTTGSYGEVSEADRLWLLNKFAAVKALGLPLISIDYVSPGNRDLARTTAAKIKELGYIPWVTDKDLRSLGLGEVEVLPRTILGFYNGSEGPDPIYSNLHRLAVMPLNYLGYQVEMHDLADPLPADILPGRYAGIIIWPNTDQPDTKNTLLKWVKLQIEQGLPVVFLDRFGFSPALIDQLPGLAYSTERIAPQQIVVLHRTPKITLEEEPQTYAKQFLPLRVRAGSSLISVGSPDGRRVFDAVAITDWGGYALQPFVTMQAIGEQGDRWILDPFEFFQKSLRLQSQPVPDTTTENGIRLLLTHIDADGFESRAEWQGGRNGATELRERILKRYRIPTSFSVISSVLGDHGLFPEAAQSLQDDARSIFALPWIEAASHTFSHPFYWQNTDVAKKNYTAQYLEIPGYQFSLESEIAGSSEFIKKHLLPPGKEVKLVQWSGDCTPGADALAMAYKNKLGNINGGATVITKSNNSLALIAPLGIEKKGYFQVFAPNQNENVYTNNWTGPFYGYRRVIETFQLTDSPRRLKPINIYHHIYSATKMASSQALDDVYSWALAQRPYAIYTSEYVDKVLDFNRTVVAKSRDGWLIRNSGDVRQVRLPIHSGYPDLAASRGVMGFSDHNDQRYIHLVPGGEAFLKLAATPPSRPWLAAASARVNLFEWTPSGLHVSVTSLMDGYIRFGNAEGCQLFCDGQSLKVVPEGKDRLFSLQAGNHELELVCK